MGDLKMVSAIQRLGRVLCLLGAVCALTFSSVPRTVEAQDLIKVRAGIILTASGGPLLIGVEKGIFKKYGFDVEIVPLTTGVQANQALASGQADWSGSGIESTVVAWGTGLPFEVYSMYAKGGDSIGILARKDSGIKTYADLKGKRVGVTVGTASSQALSQVLIAQHLSPDVSTRVNGTLAGVGPLLIAGSVDAIVAIEPFLTLTQEKMGSDAVLLGRMGKYIQGGGFFAISNKWADANRDKIPKVVEGLWEAQYWIRHNRKEADQLVSDFVKVDPRVIGISFDHYNLNPIVDEFTMTSVDHTIDYLTKEGMITQPVNATQRLAAARRIGKALEASRPDLLQ